MLSPTTCLHKKTAGGVRYYHFLCVYYFCGLTYFPGSAKFLKKNRSDTYSPQLTVLSLHFQDGKEKKRHLQIACEADVTCFCSSEWRQRWEWQMGFCGFWILRPEMVTDRRCRWARANKVPDKKNKNSAESELRFWAEEVEVQTSCLAAQITLITNFETLSSGDVYLSHKITEWRGGKRDSLGER